MSPCLIADKRTPDEPPQRTVWPKAPLSQHSHHLDQDENSLCLACLAACFIPAEVVSTVKLLFT